MMIVTISGYLFSFVIPRNSSGSIKTKIANQSITLLFLKAFFFASEITIVKFSERIESAYLSLCFGRKKIGVKNVQFVQSANMLWHFGVVPRAQI